MLGEGGGAAAGEGRVVGARVEADGHGLGVAEEVEDGRGGGLLLSVGMGGAVGGGG